MTRRLETICHVCDLLAEFKPPLNAWIHTELSMGFWGVTYESSGTLWTDHKPVVGWLSKLLAKRERRRWRALVRKSEGNCPRT